MTVRYYLSTDASAPVLTGQSNSLVALLDACLVTGYGTRTAAGWTKPFVATNAAVFRTGGSPTCDLYINDNNIVSGQEALIRGYASTTAADDTGTEPFPNKLYQVLAGSPVRKSNTIGATPRAWVVVADEQTVYVFIYSADTPSDAARGMMFGRYASYVNNDTHNWMLVGDTSGSVFTSTSFATIAHHYVKRAPTQLIGSRDFGLIPTNRGASMFGTSAVSGSINTAYRGVGRHDKSVNFSRIELTTYNHVGETNHTESFGYLKGLWSPLDYRILEDRNLIYVTHNGVVKTFINIFIGNASTTGTLFVEISNTW